MVVVIVKLQGSRLQTLRQMAICPFPKLLLFVGRFSFLVDSVEYDCQHNNVECWVDCVDNPTEEQLKKLGFYEPEL